MKNHFRFFKWLYTTVIALLGFAGCSDDPSSMADMYGVPTADYKYMGTVTDEEGNPIKGINVVFQGSRNSLHKEFHRVVTDENGRYSTDYLKWSLSSEDIYQALYTDVDGEENGGHFEDRIIETYKMEKEKIGEGNGWYNGKFELTTEVKLKAKPAEDNDETDNNENNESNE
jgi:putative lipoprotein (rSAM/lipoprotein system)